MAAEKEITCDAASFWSEGTPCVIFGASPADDGRAFLPFAGRPHFLIAADGGGARAHALGLTPSLWIGDADSGRPANAETVLLSREKDDTDLLAAAKAGLGRGFSRFILLGCTGGRLDHFLAALSVLSFLGENHAFGVVLSDGNELYWAKAPFCATIAKGAFSYFTVFPADETLTGVSIAGAKYPLHRHTLRRRETTGVSNEFCGAAAVVSADAGAAILIKSKE